MTGKRISYGALREQERGFAAALAGLGLGRGDVVAILLPNLPEYPVVFLGTALAGAASTTLNPAYTGHEIAAQLADCGACAVVTVPAPSTPREVTLGRNLRAPKVLRRRRRADRLGVTGACPVQ